MSYTVDYVLGVILALKRFTLASKYKLRSYLDTFGNPLLLHCHGYLVNFKRSNSSFVSHTFRKSTSFAEISLQPEMKSST